MDKNGSDNTPFSDDTDQSWLKSDGHDAEQKFRRRYFMGLGLSLIIAAILSMIFIVLLVSNNQYQNEQNDKLHSPPYRSTTPITFPDGTTDWKVIYDNSYHKAYYYCEVDKQWYECYPLIPSNSK